MPSQCVVCGKIRGSNVSLFSLPGHHEAVRRQAWITFIKQTRPVSMGLWEPGKRSVLCSCHFEDDQLDDSSRLQAVFSIACRVTLKPGAVPSLNKDGKLHVCPPKKCTSTMPVEPGGRLKCGAMQVQTRNSDCQVDIKPSTLSKRVSAHITTLHRSKYTQTLHAGTKEITPKTKSVAVGCNILEAPPLTILGEGSKFDEIEFIDDSADKDYEPLSQDSSTITQPSQEEVTLSPINEPKYIVFRSSLNQLLSWCHCSSCGSIELDCPEWSMKGSQLNLQLTCNSCLHVTSWSSQPNIRQIPAGNILLSASILLSGSSPTKVLRFLHHMNVAAVSRNTYHQHQRLYLESAVYKVWLHQQEKLEEKLRENGKPIVVGGDGRCDSMGHSAKYGTYTLLDLESNKVLDVQLVQSNQSGGSHGMEKKGLIQSVRHVHSVGLKLGTLVTDRHPQIRKWVRENIAKSDQTQHLYDVWHVMKGFSKKVQALAKEKDCLVIGSWIPSLINHGYWCATSTPVGNENEILAKWKSITNHVQNVHSGHGDAYPVCMHDNLDEQSRNKKWLKRGSKAAVKFESLAHNRNLCRDILKLSGIHQTSNLESFHNVIIHFAPKMLAFSNKGMLTRTMLAGLHYNENAGRAQAETKKGILRHDVRFPKYKKGEFVVRKILVNATYDYVNVIMKEIVDCCQQGRKAKAYQKPPSLASQYIKPNKKKAVSNYRSRFKKFKRT